MVKESNHRKSPRTAASPVKARRVPGSPSELSRAPRVSTVPRPRNPTWQGRAGGAVGRWPGCKAR
eukprot:573301-Hanusia_phi.AAC.1